MALCCVCCSSRRGQGFVQRVGSRICKETGFKDMPPHRIVQEQRFKKIFTRSDFLVCVGTARATRQQSSIIFSVGCTLCCPHSPLFFMQLHRTRQVPRRAVQRGDRQGRCPLLMRSRNRCSKHFLQDVDDTAGPLFANAKEYALVCTFCRFFALIG
jgi:hypothetical protein